MIDLFWMWPQRDRYAEYQGHDEGQWQPYRDAAAQAGFALTVVDADDVVVSYADDAATVFVKGRRVERDQAAFHTKLLTWPDYNSDVWRFLSTFAVLEAAGYYVTVPPMMSVVNDDKLLAFLQPWAASIPRLPTLRIMTRHFVDLADYLDPDTIKYPVLVKPGNWGSGLGVFRADDRTALTAALQLAGGGELTMLVQPLLGDRPVDCRVYCLDGEPVLAVQRTPVDAMVVANTGQGGARLVTDPPAALIEPARQVARGLDTVFVGVDFLMSSEGNYLSEIEVDATIEATYHPREIEALVKRFALLRQRFDAFVA